MYLLGHATHEAPSRGVTLHIPRWISRLTGPSLEEKCPVGATRDGDEPCLPKLSRTLKTGRTRLRYQTVLPIWPGYQHQWRACCPHGDGLTQSDERDFPIYDPRFVLPSDSLILDRTHPAGASLFHRSCAEVLSTPVSEVGLNVANGVWLKGYGEAASSGRRTVIFKDLLFQVGLAQQEVIHSSTLEANEKAPQDVEVLSGDTLIILRHAGQGLRQRAGNARNVKG